MSFPASPVLNEVFIADGKAWRWDGANWVIPKKPLPEWDEIRNKPLYYKADWNDTDNKPDYFTAKVVVSDLPPTNAVEGTVWFDATNERQYTYQQGLWIDPTTSVRTKYISTDPDVVNYIEAVEAADGEPLEQDVVTALEVFILGCKVDGIWDSIKASCILAGARTLSGAIVPLKGNAPTNTISSYNYNRKSGFKRTSTAGSFNTSRNNNSDLQNNRHLAIFITETTSVSGRMALIGAGYGEQGGTYIASSNEFTAQRYYVASSTRSTGDFTQYQTTIENTTTGFLSVSRSSSSQIEFRANSFTNILSGFHNPSTTPANKSVMLSSNINFETQGGTQRTAFYSIGESIDLALLDNRVTKLMTKLNTILP
jgi:hypothetical protein